MISIKHKGHFNKTEKFFVTVKNDNYIKNLDRFGREGVDALSAATPKKTGKTAASWIYTITRENGNIVISWSNTNENNGVNIAVILQYGHGTGTGGFVQGRDYINPAMQPIFDRIAEEAWKEVTSS